MAEARQPEEARQPGATACSPNTRLHMCCTCSTFIAIALNHIAILARWRRRCGSGCRASAPSATPAPLLRMHDRANVIALMTLTTLHVHALLPLPLPLPPCPPRYRAPLDTTTTRMLLPHRKALSTSSLAHSPSPTTLQSYRNTTTAPARSTGTRRKCKTRSPSRLPALASV